MQGTEKIALIDTVKKGFTDEYFANLKEITPLDKIDYLVVNHNEPDHSGAMAALLEQAPQIKILCSYPALPFVKNILNRDLPIESVKDDQTLDLGGKTLRFKGTPYMHWPDTMMDFLEEDKILFSCDGFAAHVAWDQPYADQSTVDWDFEVHYYFDAIMRPFTHLYPQSLAKLDGLDVQMIAPSHGPIVRKDARQEIQQYVEWCQDRTEGRNQVTLFYASSYGNTLKLTQTVAKVLTEKGLTPVTFDCFTMDIEAARDSIEASKAVLFGTPTFAGDAVRPTWDAVNLLSTVSIKGKKAAVFGSYGWGGEGLRLVTDRLNGLRLTTFEENYRAKLVPSDEEMAAAVAWAGQVADFIKG